MTSSPPGAIVVPDGIEYFAWLASLSRSLSPDTSAVVAPVLTISIQSAGEPPFDSTSLSLTLGGNTGGPWSGVPMVPGEPISFVSLTAKAPVEPDTLSREMVPLIPAWLSNEANGALDGPVPHPTFACRTPLPTPS